MGKGDIVVGEPGKISSIPTLRSIAAEIELKFSGSFLVTLPFEIIRQSIASSFRFCFFILVSKPYSRRESALHHCLPLTKPTSHHASGIKWIES